MTGHTKYLKLWLSESKTILYNLIYTFLYLFSFISDKHFCKNVLSLVKIGKMVKFTNYYIDVFLHKNIIWQTFSIFISIFLKIKLKNNVCSNLTTQTSKYRLNLSQLSHQCFTGFLLSLLSKKSKHFFFRKFFGK